jgi:hypothetical protein
MAIKQASYTALDNTPMFIYHPPMVDTAAMICYYLL